MKLRTLLAVVTLGLATALAGCTTGMVYTNSYGAVKDSGYQLPSIPIYKVPTKYHRQVVKYDTKENPGTIVVDTENKFLYLVQKDGKALRYGIGVGREGFTWKGTRRIAMKREWPTWTPPAPMIGRQPELRKWAGGMPPGLTNPLGARAMYLYVNGSDSGYRIHGSPEWFSIGKNVSSGCIRMMNQDVIDLYNRVDVGTKVIVK